MTPEYIQTLIDYNYWARDRTLASADQLSPEQLDAQPRKLFRLRARYAGSHALRGVDLVPAMARTLAIRGPDKATCVDHGRALRDAWDPPRRQIRAFVGISSGRPDWRAPSSTRP